jgi:hypothetical protein
MTLGAKWEPAENYAAWARDEYNRRDQHGYDATLTYAKRAVCRRIDGFLYYNHLGRYESDDYPSKMELLRRVGIPVRDIVHDLVITPRNKCEHTYREVTEQEAKHGVELAEMFLEASKEEAKRAAVIALNWNLLLPGNVFETRTPIEEFQEHDMILVDVFSEPPKVKIVRPQDGEVQFAELSKFSKAELIELAQWLRGTYNPDRTNQGWNAGAYQMMIQAARI